MLESANGVAGTVTLHRTFRKGVWNSICVPFTISAETVSSKFGDGTEIKELESATYDDGTGKLTLEFQTVTSITAGHPYLIKIGSAADVENPVFDGVTINKTAVKTEKTVADFVPVFNITNLPGGDEGVLFIAGDGTLSYPDPEP